MTPNQQSRRSQPPTGPTQHPNQPTWALRTQTHRIPRCRIPRNPIQQRRESHPPTSHLAVVSNTTQSRQGCNNRRENPNTPHQTAKNIQPPLRPNSAGEPPRNLSTVHQRTQAQTVQQPHAHADHHRGANVILGSVHPDEVEHSPSSNSQSTSSSSSA
jgi:hypothetical protein